MLPPRQPPASRKTPYEQPRPPQRPLKIYALDPMLSRGASRTHVVVNVTNESLELGPCGERIHVVDYDSSYRGENVVSGCYYEPVDLDDPRIAMQGGLAPSATDPR